MGVRNPSPAYTCDAMPRVLVLFAHPRLERSRTSRALLRHLPERPDVRLRDLYELYPSFDVDIGQEQQLLAEHDIVVLHHPIYWYSVPPLMKQWIDLVLAFGWAYGPGGTALRGKTWLHVTSTGGAAEAYTAAGFHGSTLTEFLRPLQRTATLCGMRWLPPFAVHGTHRLDDAGLERAAAAYGRLLNGLADGTLDPDRLAEMSTLNPAVETLSGP